MLSQLSKLVSKRIERQRYYWLLSSVFEAVANLGAAVMLLDTAKKQEKWSDALPLVREALNMLEKAVVSLRVTGYGGKFSGVLQALKEARDLLWSAINVRGAEATVEQWKTLYKASRKIMLAQNRLAKVIAETLPVK